MVAIVAKEKRLEEVSDSGCQATLFAHLEPRESRALGGREDGEFQSW